MSQFVVGLDGHGGAPLHVEPKAFLRGLLRGADPTVALVVRSDQGEVAAVIELTATDAHVLSERIRQEAELASVATEENI